MTVKNWTETETSSGYIDNLFVTLGGSDTIGIDQPDDTTQIWRFRTCNKFTQMYYISLPLTTAYFFEKNPHHLSLPLTRPSSRVNTNTRHESWNPVLHIIYHIIMLIKHSIICSKQKKTFENWNYISTHTSRIGSKSHCSQESKCI